MGSFSDCYLLRRGLSQPHAVLELL
uniref:Uncharacterized protein n=1 Tax=Arundo donax TaxID=35708 RepID=A0A0A9AWQ9_ARUDO